MHKLMVLTDALRYHMRKNFLQRVSTLQDDGYMVQFMTCREDSDMWFASLRYLSEKRTITIVAYPHKNKLIQKKDGTIVHDGILCVV